MNLILQMVLLPVYMLVFIGSSVTMEVGPMLISVAEVLLIPLVSANLIKIVLKRTNVWETVTAQLESKGDPLQLFFLCIAIIAMFASQGKAMMDNPSLFLQILLPLGIFFIINYILTLPIGKGLSMPRADIKSLVMTSLARNSPLALAVAVVVFPDQPIIPLILVIGPLIELPVLAIAVKALRIGDKAVDAEI